MPGESNHLKDTQPAGGANWKAVTKPSAIGQQGSQHVSHQQHCCSWGQLLAGSTAVAGAPVAHVAFCLSQEWSPAGEWFKIHFSSTCFSDYFNLQQFKIRTNHLHFLSKAMSLHKLSSKSHFSAQQKLVWPYSTGSLLVLVTHQFQETSLL